MSNKSLTGSKSTDSAEKKLPESDPTEKSVESTSKKLTDAPSQKSTESPPANVNETNSKKSFKMTTLRGYSEVGSAKLSQCGAEPSIEDRQQIAAELNRLSVKSQSISEALDVIRKRVEKSIEVKREGETIAESRIKIIKASKELSEAAGKMAKSLKMLAQDSIKMEPKSITLFRSIDTSEQLLEAAAKISNALSVLSGASDKLGDDSIHHMMAGALTNAAEITDGIQIVQGSVSSFSKLSVLVSKDEDGDNEGGEGKRGGGNGEEQDGDSIGPDSRYSKSLGPDGAKYTKSLGAEKSKYSESLGTDWVRCGESLGPERSKNTVSKEGVSMGMLMQIQVLLFEKRW